MKYFFWLLLIILCIITFFTGCSNAGKVNNARVTIGESSKFSKAEIEQAINVAKSNFKGIYGCELKELKYDEKRSDKEIEYLTAAFGSMNGIKADNIIVLFSEFKTGDEGHIGPGFEANYTYSWHWTLIRDNSESDWIVDSYGF